MFLVLQSCFYFGFGFYVVFLSYCLVVLFVCWLCRCDYNLLFFSIFDFIVMFLVLLKFIFDLFVLLFVLLSFWLRCYVSEVVAVLLVPVVSCIAHVQATVLIKNDGVIESLNPAAAPVS